MIRVKTLADLFELIRPSDVLTDQDIENRFSMLSLAFKTDKLTLTSRHDRQQRQRDQSERNMAAEVTKLKAAVHNLNYLCKDSESIEILGKIQDQVDVLLRSTERVSSSAEIYGAVQQESRVSKAIEVMLAHVENLKRMYEKAHAELEETKRVLLENNLVVEGTTVDGGRRDSRHRILTTTVSGQGKQRRRASIAVFRPMGSPESAKSANSPLTFGESKNHVLRGGVHSRRSASIHLENLSSGWDHIDRPDMVVGSSMDDIKELSEGRRDSGADLEDQSSNLEENNNCTVSSASRKSSRCDSPMDVRRESTGVDTDRSPLWTSDMTEEYNRCCNCTATTVSSVNSIRSYRESAMEFICQTHAALLDCIVPLNMDYVLIQTRRFITFVLLFAAFWSIVSVFVPTSAEAGSCTPISWLTIDEILRPFLQLRHHGQPPT